MVKTISMQDMRHLNLFGKITQVNTRLCFMYNEHLIFCIPKNFLSKAIGEGGKNIKKLNEVFGRRVKIVPIPESFKDARKFIEFITSPVGFKDMDINNNEIIITAGTQSKAALLGRNKRRLYELQKIVKDIFERDLRIN